jgi:Tol biopolymer transport system component
MTWGALTIFDPTVSLVVYPERKENTLMSIVWDVHGKKEIANVFGGSWPKWSPDGNRLLIVADQDAQLHRRFNEIFIITSQGEVIRSTFFESNFENHQISLPVWSPNSRYIAFWLSTVLPVRTARLAVLDTETSIVDLYCKEFDPFPFRFGEDVTLGYAYNQVNVAPLIWSPDSQHLLMEDYKQFTSSTYLLDLKEHNMTIIVEGARPISWMK